MLARPIAQFTAGLNKNVDRVQVDDGAHRDRNPACHTGTKGSADSSLTAADFIRRQHVYVCGPATC